MPSTFEPLFVKHPTRLAAIARHLYPQSRAKRLRFLARAGFYADVTRIWLDFLAAEKITGNPDTGPALADRAPPAPAVSARRFEPSAAPAGPAGSLPHLRRSRLADGPVLLARFQGKQGAYRLELGYWHRFGKEGEWSLQTHHDGERLYSLAFSFQRPRQPHLFIACLQGPTGEHARDAVRRATRDLHDMRPRDLILDAAREIAGAAGMKHIGIVHTRDHVYRHPRSRFKKRNTRTAWEFDYDTWAAEIGAQAGDDGWMLPTEAQHRDPAELPSKKRAAARRRAALREQIADQIRLALESVIAPVALQAAGESVRAKTASDALAHDAGSAL